MNQFVGMWLIRTQTIFVIIMSYQLYLAVTTEIIDDALKQVREISSWPVQALNLALFVLVLLICWVYLQQTRKDLQKLQTANDSERREFIDSLKTLVSDTAKVVERNNSIFERIDRRLERAEDDRKTRS